jgi:ABC-2 type transport system permease protein
MNVALVVEEKTSKNFEVLLAPQAGIADGGKAARSQGCRIDATRRLARIREPLAAFAMTARAGMSGEMKGFSFSSFGVTPLQLLFFLLFFVLGFLFYSAIGAGFSASVSSEQEVQQFSLSLCRRWSSDW